MPALETKNFGNLSYQTESVIEFPCGLPGFEDRGKFVAVRIPESEPLIFLQSLEDPALCFITMPVRSVDPRYRLTVNGEDLARLGLPQKRRPRIGEQVLCLTVIAMQEGGPTANLLAPIVVNVRNLKAVQAIAPDSGYSHQQVLMPRETAVCS